MDERKQVEALSAVSGHPTNLGILQKIGSVMKLRKVVVVFAFLHSTLLSYSQEEVKKTHLGFSIVPQATKFHFQSDQVEDNELEFNYAVGGNLIRDLSAKTQLMTGLVFQKINIAYTDYTPAYPGDVMDGQYVPTLSYWLFNYSNYFLGVPLELKIKLNQAEIKNHFFINGGIRFQYLLGNSGYVQLVETGYVWEERDFDSFYFDENRFWSILTGGIGYEFKLGKGKCFINPVYEYSLTKLYKEDTAIDANGRSTSFGIRVVYY